MSWLDKIVPAAVRRGEQDRKTTVPEGLWHKCVKCEAVSYTHLTLPTSDLV